MFKSDDNFNLVSSKFLNLLNRRSIPISIIIPKKLLIPLKLLKGVFSIIAPTVPLNILLKEFFTSVSNGLSKKSIILLNSEIA